MSRDSPSTCRCRRCLGGTRLHRTCPGTVPRHVQTGTPDRVEFVTSSPHGASKLRRALRSSECPACPGQRCPTASITSRLEASTRRSSSGTTTTGCSSTSYCCAPSSASAGRCSRSASWARTTTSCARQHGSSCHSACTSSTGATRRPSTRSTTATATCGGTGSAPGSSRAKSTSARHAVTSSSIRSAPDCARTRRSGPGAGAATGSPTRPPATARRR
jgi:hypothetical protein